MGYNLWQDLNSFSCVSPPIRKYYVNSHKHSLSKRTTLFCFFFPPIHLSTSKKNCILQSCISLKWCLAATSGSQCGVSPDGMSCRSSSVTLTASQQWSGSCDEITQALRNICVPLGKYHEMRPHYIAEIQCSVTKSILSRAGHKKPLNVLIRSKRNSGCSL